MVSLLTLAYAISLLDRWILSLLVGPVKAHFGVSDTQMGLLMGFWFAVFYVTMGLPFGWLADRFNRRALVGAAMLFWCSMTAFCGLAKTFGQLSAARLGIGLGEAALTPAANSIIADYFPRERQNSAITFFNMGISTGMGIAYLVGGLIVGWMATQPPLVLPVFGQLETWQVVFLAAGAPGLVVAALILLTIREPLRRGRLARSASEASLPRLHRLHEGAPRRLPAAVRRHGGVAARRLRVAVVADAVRSRLGLEGVAVLLRLRLRAAGLRAPGCDLPAACSPRGSTGPATRTRRSWRRWRP